MTRTLGTPVLPLVYMMIAVSSAEGGLASHGVASPNLIQSNDSLLKYFPMIYLRTELNDKTLTSSGKPSVLVLKRGSSMKITVLTLEHDPLIMLDLSLGSRE